MSRAWTFSLLSGVLVLVSSCDGSGTSAPRASATTLSDPGSDLGADLDSAPDGPEADTPVPAPDPEAEAEPEPEPESDPVPEPEPEPEPVTWGHADLDPDNDNVIGPPEPLADCEAKLEAAGIRFKAARIGVGRKVDGVYTCGAHQVVRFQQGPGKISYEKNSPMLTCTMALALADFERVAQEEAERFLGSPIKTIEHMGTYNCREMVNFDLISEHSFANGIDLKRFVFKNGKSATVLDDFHPEIDNPSAPETLFLRSLARRLYDEQVFSVVVTPYFDNLHRNHIHVDLARYRVDGARP